MDHLSFALYDVPAVSSGPLRLAGSFPEGTDAAIALVARSGSIDGGQVTTRAPPSPGRRHGRRHDRRPRALLRLGRPDHRRPRELGRVARRLGRASRRLALVPRRPARDRAARPRTFGAPRASLRGFRLRSRDADRLSFTATLRQDGRDRRAAQRKHPAAAPSGAAADRRRQSPAARVSSSGSRTPRPTRSASRALGPPGRVNTIRAWRTPRAARSNAGSAWAPDSPLVGGLREGRRAASTRARTSSTCPDRRAPSRRSSRIRARSAA